MKHSKLFLTGMAALLLSFGLMMTGCDSGGDSDSNTGPAAGDYISIEEDPVGDANTAAVFTVTVKQSLAGKVVTFTNVADDVVVYGPPANADDTPVNQAAAIVTKLNAAAGAKYTAAQTDNTVAVFTLTAPGNGEVTAKPDFTIENYTAPPAKTSDAFTVAENDNALKITGTVNATGTFNESAKVYIKDGGKEVLITDETPAPTGYTAPGGTVVLIAATESNKPVLWVKGLDAAVTSATDGKILASTAGATDVKVVITGGAQTGNVGDITAVVSGTAVVLPAGEKTLIAFASASANQVSVKGGDGSQIHYHNGTGDVTATLSTTFDTQLSTVLAATGLLAADDKITVDAKGIITSAEIAAASPTAAKINAVLGVLDNVTIGLDTALAATEAVAIAAGKVLTLKTGIELSFASGSGTVGAKITGAGKLVAGFTEIIPGATGVIGSSTSGEVVSKIKHDESTGKTTITGVSNQLLAVSSGAVITQKTGNGSELALAANTNVNILDGGELKLETGAILSGADNTGIVNVGETTTTKFAIKGVASGTLTAGNGTVSLLGLATGSKILGSAATATLTGGGADMDIAVAAAATEGAVIDTVTLDLSVNGKISITQNGVLKLAPNGGITTAAASGTDIDDTGFATGTSTTIRGTGSGCTITAGGAVTIDDGDTFASSSGVVTVTPA